MREEKNLYRMDDVLIRAGATMGALVGLALLGCFLLPSEALWSIREALGLGVLGLAGIALAPIGLLAAGFHVRKRERRVLTLHTVLDRQLELRVRDFVANTEFTRELLQKTLLELNESGLGYYVWDRDTDTIQDARLRRGEMHFDHCEACRATISVTVEIGASVAPECPYCSARLASEDLAKEKQRLIDEIRANDPRRRATLAPSARTATWREGRHSRGDAEFSVPLFLVLMVVCWPLAAVYAVRYAYRNG